MIVARRVSNLSPEDAAYIAGHLRSKRVRLITEAIEPDVPIFYDALRIYDRARWLAERLIKSLEQPVEIRVGLVESKKPIAFATKLQGKNRYGIFFSFNLEHCLGKVAEAILTGNAMSLAFRLPLVDRPPTLSGVSKMVDFIGVNEGDIVLHESDRRYLAKLAKFSAVDFVIHHELTHISHGHIDFINAPYLARNYKINDVNYMQALEFDADIAALGKIVQSALKTYPPDPHRFAKGRLRVNYTLPYFGACIANFTFGSETLDWKAIYDSSHPTGSIRSLYLSMKAQLVLLEMAGDGANEIRREISLTYMSIIKGIMNSFEEVTGNQFDTIPFESAMVGGYDLGYMNDIFRHWHNIYRDLSMFKKCKDIPEPKPDIGLVKVSNGIDVDSLIKRSGVRQLNRQPET